MEATSLHVPALASLRHVMLGKSKAGNGLSFDLSAGETVTLLGPPGAGKTALLMALAGFARPSSGEMSSGEIRLRERLVARTPPQRRPVGLMAPYYPLFAPWSIAANLEIALDARGVPPARWSFLIAGALDLTGLADQSDRLPAALSDLDRRRAALARAIVARPALLLLDAPLDGLDAPAREAFTRDIFRLRAPHRAPHPAPHPAPGANPGDAGMGIIHATRDPEEAFALADRVAVLVDGSLRQIGTPQSLYENPADATVARLVGAANLLPGVAEAAEDGIALIRLTCGPVVEARLADAIVGAPCLVSVPPERIAVAAISAAEMGEGALPATLIAAAHRGDHVRLRLLVGEPGAALAEVTVKRPSNMPLGGLSPGAAAAIAWQPTHAQAFRPQ